MLSRFGGLTQREIAERLGVGTGKAVSDQLQRLSAALQIDKPRSRLVKAVEAELEDATAAFKH